MAPMRFEDQAQLSVPPEQLWPLVSDTQRMNRVIGLQAVDFAFTPREEGGSVVTGEFRRFGITMARWTEHAFDFVMPQRYSILREYSSGPLISLLGGVELTPKEGGTLPGVRRHRAPKSSWQGSSPPAWSVHSRLPG